MTSDGSPEHRRPSLVDINLASVERRRREGPPPISPFSIIVVLLILILAYAIFPFATLTEDSDIPNLYGVWHEQQDDIDSLKDTLAEKEELRDWLIALAGEAGDVNERIDELESLLGDMELDYTALSQDTVTWSEVLEAIEDAAPVGVTLTSIEEGSSIDIEGTAATDALISEYAAALEDTGLFSDVDITEHELDENTSASSEISIEKCETVWNSPGTQVFTLVDSKDYTQGLYSAKQSITTSFTTGLVAYQNEARDLRDGKYIVLWLKSSTDLPAGVFQLVFYSPAFAPPTFITLEEKQYTNDTDIGIPDYPFDGPVDPAPPSDIIVPSADDLIITSVDVYVKIVHTREADLIVKVKHPNGTEYVLHNAGDGAGADIDRWYPYPGPTPPAEPPIAIFNGFRSLGTWQLLVQDTVTDETGYIDSWTLKINGTIPLTPATDATPTPTATPIAWPTIDYSPLSLCFSARAEASPFPQTLQIWNSTGGTLNWSVSSNVTWLTTDLASGSSTGEVDFVTVAVNVAGMSTGSHTATITIKDTTALNSPQTVPVYLTIREPVMVERLGLPGLNADSWTEVILPLSDASKICPDYSVALYATQDPGACVIWLDDIRATLEPTPGPYEFTITVTLAGGGS